MHLCHLIIFQCICVNQINHVAPTIAIYCLENCCRIIHRVCRIFFPLFFFFFLFCFWFCVYPWTFAHPLRTPSAGRTTAKRQIANRDCKAKGKAKPKPPHAADPAKKPRPKTMVFQANRYYMHAEGAHDTVWICATSRYTKCTARLCIDVTGANIRASGQHDHASNIEWGGIDWAFIPGLCFIDRTRTVNRSSKLSADGGQVCKSHHIQLLYRAINCWRTFSFDSKSATERKCVAKYKHLRFIGPK